MTHPDDMPLPPDGPTPAREQLPLPRRRRQSHLEPQLRTPGGTGAGTPFTAFVADGDAEPTATIPSDRRERGRPSGRAAAFHAGAHRGRGTAPGHAEP
ncbi:hypothetical protein [Pseudonocardia adelaidensis]|uniref:Uncharacterized protein n=1 Tax=Pseudonocardia adelaidensis TaxID=648754 RepID=A0ABP9NS18_9PSEU